MPEKKRGRKKKEKVNAETDEEKLIVSIVASARQESQPLEENSVSEVSKSSSEASTKELKNAAKLAAKESENASKLAAKEAQKAEKSAAEQAKILVKDAVKFACKL